MTGITQLSLNNNDLTSIPTDIANLTNLTTGSIRYNCLDLFVPSVLTDFLSLKNITYDPQDATCGGSVTPIIPPDLCDTVTAIPVPQCEALISLFNNTDGENWNVTTNR
jgi:hypothetical protein